MGGLCWKYFGDELKGNWGRMGVLGVGEGGGEGKE